MILEIALVVIVCVLSFLFYRQDRTIKSQIDYIERIEQKFLMNFESISEAVVKMKEADSKGGFQSDDEIGIIFKELQKIIIDLEKEIKGE